MTGMLRTIVLVICVMLRYQYCMWAGLTARILRTSGTELCRMCTLELGLQRDDSAFDVLLETDSHSLARSLVSARGPQPRKSASTDWHSLTLLWYPRVGRSPGRVLQLSCVDG